MPEAKELDNLLGSEEEEPKKTEGGEEEEEKGEEEEVVIPEKFKGKSAEEIAKSYVELEKMIEKKAREKAEEILKTKEEEGEEEEEKGEEEEEITLPTTKEGEADFSSMTPNQFAKWVIQEIEKRAEVKVREIYEDSARVKESVSAEIAAAQENYPLLKTNDKYRELVLSIIEAAASKGEIVSLEDACKRVDEVIGEKEEIGREEEEKLKRAKAVVERGAGAPVIRTPDTEEERIKKALLGEGPKSSLGGLGI